MPPKDRAQWAAAYAPRSPARCVAGDCPRSGVDHVHPRHAPHLYVRIDPDTGTWLGRAEDA
jgi:hypothetical protein